MVTQRVVVILREGRRRIASGVVLMLGVLRLLDRTPGERMLHGLEMSVDSPELRQHPGQARPGSLLLVENGCGMDGSE